MRDLVLKSLFLISLIAFIDFLIMIVIGCTTCFFGLSDEFYDCTYCAIGKVVFIISIISLFSILLFNYKSFSLRKMNKN